AESVVLGLLLGVELPEHLDCGCEGHVGVRAIGECARAREPRTKTLFARVVKSTLATHCGDSISLGCVFTTGVLTFGAMLACSSWPAMRPGAGQLLRRIEADC